MNGVNAKDGVFHDPQVAKGSQEKATADRATEKGIFSLCEKAGDVGGLIHNGTMPSEGTWKDLEGSQQKDGSLGSQGS